MREVTRIWDKLKLFWSKTNRWHRVLFILTLVELRCIPGGQWGFECNDPALSYPFAGDTIDWKWLLSTTAFLPLAVMLIAEKKYHQNEKTNGKSKTRALYWYKQYFFGFLVNTALIQTTKMLVGAPRPHFFDTCQPREAFSCQGSEYVPTYTCTKGDWHHQSNRSFPSGHTSLALHAGIYIAYYLRQRASHSRAARGCAWAALVAAALCCASRVADRRHHGRDVLAGAAAALPVLLYTISHLCNNFQCREEKETDQSNHSSPQKEANNLKKVET